MKRYIVKLASDKPKETISQIEQFMDEYTQIVLSLTQQYGDIRCEFVMQEELQEDCDREYQCFIKALRKQFKDYIYAYKDCTIEEVVVEELIKKNRSVSCAESCTGGLLSGRLVNVSGVSAVFDQSYVTYANCAKAKLLDVKNETLRLYGAVSEQTAMEMAFGVARAADSFYGLSVTGIAGPEGGTKEKPVGLVYIGCSELDVGAVRKFYFEGDRITIRQTAVTMALKFLHDMITRSEHENYCGNM